MPSSIDVHVHVPVESNGPGREVEELAAKYKRLDILANILGRDARTATGQVEVENDYVASVVKKYPDTFMGFGSVDPWMGKVAIYEVERAVKELGLKGLKVEPYRSEFYLNDRRLYPLWEKIQELGVPIMTHTGTLHGAGHRHYLKYNRPIPYIDDLAADFPGLTIVGCHPSFPWQDEMLAVAAHKGNVHIELSAEWPKYFSANLIQYTNTFLQDKVMFGTGYPRIEPEDWLADFEAQSFTTEVKPKVLLKNAARLFGVTIS